MNLPTTVDWLEIVVFSLGLVGLTISLLMVAVIQGDRRNIRLSGLNGVNKRLANADMRNELSRTYKLLGFTLTALLFMTVPPPIRRENQYAGEIIKWMLVSWEVVAVGNSLWSFVDRIKNREELRARREAEMAAAASMAAGVAANTLAATTNASDAAANAADSAANSEDALANASDAATNAANAATNAAGRLPYSSTPEIDEFERREQLR